MLTYFGSWISQEGSIKVSCYDLILFNHINYIFRPVLHTWSPIPVSLVPIQHIPQVKNSRCARARTCHVTVWHCVFKAWLYATCVDKTSLSGCELVYRLYQPFNSKDLAVFLFFVFYIYIFLVPTYLQPIFAFTHACFCGGYVVRTQGDTGRTCKLHTERPFEQPHLIRSFERFGLLLSQSIDYKYNTWNISDIWK